MPTGQTGNATNALQLMHFPFPPWWGAHFPDPGHFLSLRGEGTGDTKYHVKQYPHTRQLGRRTRHTTAFACNKYLPTGRAALSEFFSTLKGRVATSLGAVQQVVWPCTEAGLDPQGASGESFPHPHSSDFPARAS